ncbi:MAG: hypothetical protein K5697_00745 [Lachnospiraceae bacterium]|nr:hypothetical protein [Lachnospiraceae bacterium]
MIKFKYTNPLTAKFQAEYALYEAASELFSAVNCESFALETLKLYFAELSEEKKKALRKEMKYLVRTQLENRVLFPAMDICRADVRIRRKADGTHSFTFTDEVYRFTVCVRFGGKGKEKKLMVRNYTQPCREFGGKRTGICA